MRCTWMGGAVLAALMMTAGGCGSKQDDSALLREEATNLRAQLEQRNNALSAAEADRRTLAMQLAELRRQLEDANARAADVGRTTGFEGIENVQSVYGDGEITLIIESDVLFDSGQATLKQSSQRSLSQVASVLNSQYPGNGIRITGHTDTDPIQKSGWKSNFHLGAERAYAVMEYLRQRGVEVNRMHIASFGPNRPMGTKQASRRVEIAVLLNE